MRVRHVLALLFVVAFGASCRQILGIEEATLICPEELADCAICSAPGDCPAATECHSWACVDALCTPVNTLVHTPCSKGFCSDASPSECVACVEDEDCAGPGGHCGLGECFSCFDGIENGHEFGVDCGGPCKGCLGLPCTSPDDCVSGFCADLVCCTSTCTDTCASCSFPESGNCTSIPMYQHDDNPVCSGKYQCNGGGGCGLRPSEFCMSAVDCVTGRCVDSRCAKLPGEECNQPEECAKMSCVNGVCAM